MSFDPSNYTYEEPEDRSHVLLPKGSYQFSIVRIDAIENSKNGNPMMPIQIEVEGPNGAIALVYDRLVFTEKTKWKIDQFMKSICSGTLQSGRRMSFTDPKTIKWMLAQKGWVKLGVEMAQGKTKDYERNCIEAYLPEAPKMVGAAPSAPSAPAGPAVVDDSDDIPF